MLKKISNILLTIFSVGVTAALLAGALALLGFVIAMFIGGETASAMSVFIHKTYFPWVIRITSAAIGCGLLGMYFSKQKSLTFSKEDDKD